MHNICQQCTSLLYILILLSYISIIYFTGFDRGNSDGFKQLIFSGSQ